MSLLNTETEGEKKISNSTILQFYLINLISVAVSIDSCMLMGW